MPSHSPVACCNLCSLQSVAKSAKMLHYVNYRMKVTIQDGRTLVGTLMAFDKHMNLVLGDCEESRRIKSKKAAGGSTCPSLAVLVHRGYGRVSFAFCGAWVDPEAGCGLREAATTAALLRASGCRLPRCRNSSLSRPVPVPPRSLSRRTRQPLHGFW